MLEYWSQLNNVFQFVRVEDIAYDKRPPAWATSSTSSTRAVGTAGGPGAAGRSTNGRVWKMVLDPDDPTEVTSLTILVEGDNSPVKTLSEIHQPDNIETTQTGMLVTEDPGSASSSSRPTGAPNATTARLWYVPFSGSPEVVAKVNQSADGIDGRGSDVDGASVGAWGPALGSRIQRHRRRLRGVRSGSIPDRRPGAHARGSSRRRVGTRSSTPDRDPDFTFKREGGQLLLIRIPGI